ncbi:unnamed protein product, partial [marine sediment metagenome]
QLHNPAALIARGASIRGSYIETEKLAYRVHSQEDNPALLVSGHPKSALTFHSHSAALYEPEYHQDQAQPP